MSLKRVVVTGLGAVCPMGSNVEMSWNNLCSGYNPMKTFTEQDDPDWKDVGYRVGASVHPSFNKDIWYTYMPDAPSKQGAFSIACVHEALTDADWKPDSEEKQYRTGIDWGCTNPAQEEQIENVINIGKYGLNGGSNVALFPMLMAGSSASIISQTFKIKGAFGGNANACSSSMQSIANSVLRIQMGDADVMVAGGVDNVVNPYCFNMLNRIGPVNSNSNDDPLGASRPFDEGRGGYIATEGASCLILEEYEHAIARGAKIYCEIVGYGNASDGEVSFQRPRDDGLGLIRAATAALKNAGISASDISVLVPHGTATIAGDASELTATFTLFGDYDVPMANLKSHFGHLGGASGATESVLSALMVQQNICPPSINLENPIEIDGRRSNASDTLREMPINYLMKNSIGIAGYNVVMIFKKATN